MKKFQLFIVTLFSVVVLVLGTQSTAQAILSLWLHDDYNFATIVVADQSPQDSNPTPGIVTFNGTFDETYGNWTISLTAMSKPVIGSASFQTITFNGLATTTGTPGGIEVAVKEKDFTTPVNTLFLDVSGNCFQNGGFFTALYDPNNTGNFSPIGGPITPPIPYVSGSFGGQEYSSFTANADFSLAILGELNGGVYFSDVLAPLQPVPVPPSLLLLGSGLLGLGALGWWKNRIGKP